MTDPLAYVLSSLRRAAENAYPWSLTPNEAGALVAEVERLRAECEKYREAISTAIERLQKDQYAIPVLETAMAGKGDE